MKLFHPSLVSMILLTALPAAAQVARWDFGVEEASRLTPHGGVHRDVPGPRPPEFPDFDAKNTAVQFDGDGAHFSFEDEGPGSGFDFTNGDAITLEAWVKLDDVRTGENLYVIGKGRTGAEGFAADNQNWALRVREQHSKACVSFLFATMPASGVAKTDAHWHRWTTTDGFAVKSGWHHIAVSYRFGEPDSVRGWLDGKVFAGAWDMGGATTEAPVVDDDAIWIGSAKGGAAANSFRGTLDAVSVHRGILGDDVLLKRFRRTGDAVVAKAAKEVMPAAGPLPHGKVLVTFHETMPAKNRWLNEGENVSGETTRWLGDTFLLRVAHGPQSRHRRIHHGLHGIVSVGRAARRFRARDHR
ncbi:MAG: LamG-like jellyroll fold domain-containing protein, partial [Chthoniobacteraceae bacterium]